MPATAQFQPRKKINEETTFFIERWSSKKLIQLLTERERMEKAVQEIQVFKITTAFFFYSSTVGRKREHLNNLHWMITAPNISRHTQKNHGAKRLSRKH